MFLGCFFFTIIKIIIYFSNFCGMAGIQLAVLLLVLLMISYATFAQLGSLTSKGAGATTSKIVSQSPVL